MSIFLDRYVTDGACYFVQVDPPRATYPEGKAGHNAPIRASSYLRATTELRRQGTQAARKTRPDWAGGQTASTCLAMTMRWTSLVPSPISQSLASRKCLSMSNSRTYP